MKTKSPSGKIAVITVIGSLLIPVLWLVVKNFGHVPDRFLPEKPQSERRPPIVIKDEFAAFFLYVNEGKMAEGIMYKCFDSESQAK